MDKSVVRMNQIHSNNVVVVGKSDIGKIIPKCDGLITTDKGVKLVVQTADCLPIMIKDLKNDVVAILHAGWRGLHKKIIGEAIKKMRSEFGTRSEDLIVGIGSHICPKHYEVKEDVSKYFTEITTKKGKMYLDLAEVAKNQFIKIGVNEINIKVDLNCTFENKNLPSYRRDRNSGRLETSVCLN